MSLSQEGAVDASYDDNSLKRKRIRIPKSCIPCLKGKRACDRARPACGRCTRSNLSSECAYDARLPDAANPNSSKQTAKSEYDSDNDDKHDPSYDSPLQLSRLQSELQEARNETQRLRSMLSAQQPTHGAATANGSYPAPHYQRSRAYSRSQDMHAARGLQMLAEIAGPTHQDASTNADKAGVLNWTNRSVNNSSSSTAPSTHVSPASGAVSSASSQALGSLPTLSTSINEHSPSHGQWRSPIENKNTTSFSPEAPTVVENGNGPPRNRNGTHIYYGGENSGGQFLRRMTAGSVSTDVADEIAPKLGPALGKGVNSDVQTAFNSLLDPSHDTFPFATIWSSGPAFFDEVLPFFPSPEEFDSICASFVRHFSAMCPALTIPFAINHARTFSRMTRQEKGQVSLPWLAVFLMICALGKDCDLESAASSVDKKVMMLDAFLSGDVSQQPSRSSSPLASGSEGLAGDKANNSKSSVMVSDIYLSAAYQSLRLCSFLSSPTLQTIHSQLLVGSYLLNTERAASFWPLLGSVARQAQSIGLHVDPYKIKSDWDPVEADIRRRLWWAIVHQDVILSGIFGRPLGITRFSCEFPSSSDRTVRTFATLQCEFSQLARTCLDENQDRGWSQQQVTAFTEKVLQWYMGIPAHYRPDLGRLDLFRTEPESEVVQNWTAAGVDLNTKGLMEVHQSGNLAVEVFYTLLALHRSNILPPAPVDMFDGNLEGQITVEGAQINTGDKLNEVSLHICAQALRRITRAQQTMNDVLGRARGTMFWKIAYYTYQAAIAGAYIVFLRPQSKHAESALSDLAVLTDYFDRMPERWKGLKTAKHGLRVLRKLAIAARENPKAASMPLKNSASAGHIGASQGEMGRATPASANTVANVTVPADLSLAMPALTANKNTPAPLPQHLTSTLDPSTPSSGSVYANTGSTQSMFLPALFSSSFLPSPNIGSPGGSIFGISSSAGHAGSHLFAAATGTGTGGHGAMASPTVRGGFSSTPLALFNSSYDLQENASSTESGGSSKAAFCYDPFIPDSALTSAASVDGMKERDSPNSSSTSVSPASSSSSTSALNTLYALPTTTAATAGDGATPFIVAAPYDNDDASTAADLASGPPAPHDPTNLGQLNHKELANYWSEYFSLQLDWDRLSGLT